MEDTCLFRGQQDFEIFQAGLYPMLLPSGLTNALQLMTAQIEALYSAEVLSCGEGSEQVSPVLPKNCLSLCSGRAGSH